MKPFPDVLEIPPLQGAEHHTHTFILLHGRGSNAERFGRELLTSSSIATRLPTVKFVFPTAKRRRSTVLNRILIHQWFDNYSLDDPGQRTDLQIEGLAESGQFLRELVDREASLFGEREANYKRIVIGGLSQGCAMGCFALLGGLAGSSRLGAFVGLSGWLPFQGQLDNILAADEKSLSYGTDDTMGDVDIDAGAPSESNSENSDMSDEDDIIDTAEHGPELPKPIQALNHVRDILDLPPITVLPSHPQQSPHYLETPVFLGHGAADPKVSVKLGEDMANILSIGLQMDLTWRSYKDFGHWYKIPDEIDDVLRFLEEKTDILVEKVVV